MTGGSRKAENMCSQCKSMFVCFFDHKGIFHYEFIAQGQKESAVLFRSADKVTGLCFEEKTQTLA
jgi:hypothetical protein